VRPFRAAPIGVLIAHGRDAADVPLTHIFGPGTLSGFRVWAEQKRPELNLGRALMRPVRAADLLEKLLWGI
jgi:hypothetical protein